MDVLFPIDGVLGAKLLVDGSGVRCCHTHVTRVMINLASTGSPRIFDTFTHIFGVMIDNLKL